MLASVGQIIKYIYLYSDLFNTLSLEYFMQKTIESSSLNLVDKQFALI